MQLCLEVSQRIASFTACRVVRQIFGNVALTTLRTAVKEATQRIEIIRFALRIELLQGHIQLVNYLVCHHGWLEII